MRLERERDHFYKSRSSHLEAPSSSRQDESDDVCYAADYGGIKEKLDISNGKHSFNAEEKIAPRNHIDYMIKTHKERMDQFDDLYKKESSSRSKVSNN
jgi:hypothetical protein